MHLDEKQIKRANGFYNVIKNFMNMKPEDYVKSGIKICKDCNGTGLGGVWESSEGGEDHGWDTYNYCGICYGVGFINVDTKFEALSDTLFICNKCQGVGCIQCDYLGMVDWITHARGE